MENNDNSSDNIDGIPGNNIDEIPGNLLTKKDEGSKMIPVCESLRNHYKSIKN